MEFDSDLMVHRDSICLAPRIRWDRSAHGEGRGAELILNTGYRISAPKLFHLASLGASSPVYFDPSCMGESSQPVASLISLAFTPLTSASHVLSKCSATKCDDGIGRY
jgi:hypothetical protein